jgi:tryptophan-rich sensory protein
MEYIIAFVSVLITAILGSYFTSKSTNSEWYKCIKPRALTPPNYVFPIVWTVLYILLVLAFANALKLKYKPIIILFILLFILHIVWCYFYFFKKNISSAAIIIVFLIIVNIAIVGLAIYKNQNHLANLLIPHLLWIAFACILNILSLKKIKMCHDL